MTIFLSEPRFHVGKMMLIFKIPHKSTRRELQKLHQTILCSLRATLPECTNYMFPV